MPSYYECYYDYEDYQELCGAECSQNISATFSRICDYFRKPVYRRSADV